MHTGITPSMVLRYINRMIGAIIHKIEITNDEIMNVVFQESLLTFSKFYPYIYREHFRGDSLLKGGDPVNNVYKITSELEIMGVSNIWVNNIQYYGRVLMNTTMNPFTNQMMQDKFSATLTPTTFRFEKPDILRIYPKVINTADVLVELKAVHPKHMKTIGVNMRDLFLKLCLYDVLISLYPIRHRFETLSTPYGEIVPFFNMMDNAAADREDLITRFEDNYIKQSGYKRIFIK